MGIFRNEEFTIDNTSFGSIKQLPDFRKEER